MATTDTPSTASPDLPDAAFTWHRVIGVDDLEVGRITTVTIERHVYAVAHTSDGCGAC